jgi:outer membrane protein
MRVIQQIRRAWRVAAAVAGVLSMFASGTTVSASEQAQEPQQPSLQGAGAAAAPGQSVLQVSPDDAVRMALENNLGLRAEQLNPQIENYGLAQAKSAFAPSLISLTTTRNSTQPPGNFLTGAGTLLTSDSFSTNAGLQQLVPWGGGRYQVTWDASRLETSDASSRYNPQLGSGLNLSFTQPLLRNFAIDNARQQVLSSEKRVEIADVQLQETLSQAERTVRNAYYDLVGAIASLEVSQQSLDLARQSLRNNERRVEVGTMAPIDIVQAQAEVAANEESVIVAEGQIRAAEDRLRTLIMNPAQADFWTTRLEPAEQPTLTPRPVDVDGAIRAALDNRTDIIRARKQMDQVDLDTRYYRNQRLPNIDVTANYNLVGTAGTQRLFDYTTGVPTVTDQIQRNFSDALRDVLGNEFRTWSVQLNISYPLGTSTADAALAQARLARQQQNSSLANLETQIVASVREAGRQVETTLKRVESTRKARELAEQGLQAEEKRLAVGLSDTFRLFQAQRDLSRQKVNELNAIIAYNRALVDFDVVQKVPLR